MNKVLRVLMVDDSPADAELIVHQLNKSGWQLEHELVDTAHDMRRALGEKQWDVILCDYSMPNMNPYMALDILRETELDIPLIVISGRIGEEEAIKLLKAGCHDCLIKSDLRRLPDVINRETKEAIFRGETRIILENKMSLQNEEKEKRAAELAIASEELLFQNEEKEKRAAELAIANKELLFQNEEKEKRAAELAIANKELLFQNEEKEKRAAELAIANREIIHQKVKQKELEFASYHDLLTGLYNRRFYEEELKRLDTSRNLPITLVMGDVNGLKLINDTFGHAMGDELLKKAAEVIKKGCRTDDIIARLGGDEFVILLPKTSALDAERIIERIKDMSIGEKVYGLDISVSFGYKTKTKNDEEMAEIFKIAEDRMYSNKRSVNI